jgi:hypothetical protein
MNRRRTFLTASALTLVFGVAPATVWIFRQRYQGKRTSRDIPLAAAQVVSAAEQSPDATDTLDKIFTKDDSLSYKGYRIEKAQAKGDEESWFATLKKGNKTVAKFDAGWNKEGVSFGLFSFISTEPKQLVVEQYSGGAHCCYSYSIYDLSGANARLLFNSDKYGTGDPLLPVDLDNDGTFELRHYVMAFDYFHTSHASSVFPVAVFAYDKKAGEYRLANRRFSTYVLGGIEDDIKELETLKAQRDRDGLDTERHFSAVLQVTLKYIYAGKRDEGWAFFEREYRTHEGISKEKMRAEIEETLAAEPVYKYIYSAQSEEGE